jgi:hypothetical protein
MAGAAESFFPGTNDWSDPNYERVLTDSEVSCTYIGGNQKFRLCTAPYARCSNELIGTVQNNDFTFLVEEGTRCHEADAKEALLNSMSAHRFEYIRTGWEISN